MWHPSRQTIAAAVAALLLISGSGACAAESDEPGPRISCDRISLLPKPNPLSGQGLVSEISAAVPATCPQIIRQFIGEDGQPLPLQEPSDDIGILSNYREKVDKLCTALLASYNAGATPRATACRFNFQGNRQPFQVFVKLMRNGKLRANHMLRNRNVGLDHIRPDACARLPLRGDTGQNEFAQAMIAEFGRGADWSTIASQLHQGGFENSRPALYTISFFVTTGRALPITTAEYESESKSLSFFVGAVSKLPARLIDIGCGYQSGCEPNYVCIDPLVSP